MATIEDILNAGKGTTSTTSGLAYNSLLNADGSSKWNSDQWLNFGTKGGTIDANNNLVFGAGDSVGNYFTNNSSPKEAGMFDWLGSDNMKGIGTLGGLAMSGLGIFNTMNSQKEAKKQWEAENARANEIMAMNKEKYNQYKADRNRLNSEYV